MRMGLKLRAAAAAIALCLAASGAQAAGDVEHPHQEHWSFNGIFGHYDRAEAQRGLQVFLTVCTGCHGAKYLRYGDLAGLGYDEDQIKAIAGQFEVPAGPNEDGDIFDADGYLLMRTARPTDTFPAPYANDKAAAAMNFGIVPPDLSVMVKARHDGANYIYALLTGYHEPPEDLEIGVGLAYNPYFPGHQIAMSQPLWGEDVEYADGTEATLEQEARDVVTFLAWASEPDMERRKNMGLTVMLFVLVMTGLFYATKRKVWKDLH